MSLARLSASGSLRGTPSGSPLLLRLELIRRGQIHNVRPLVAHRSVTSPQCRSLQTTSRTLVDKNNTNKKFSPQPQPVPLSQIPRLILGAAMENLRGLKRNFRNGTFKTMLRQNPEELVFALVLYVYTMSLPAVLLKDANSHSGLLHLLLSWCILFAFTSPTSTRSSSPNTPLLLPKLCAGHCTTATTTLISRWPSSTGSRLLSCAMNFTSIISLMMSWASRLSLQPGSRRLGATRTRSRCWRISRATAGVGLTSWRKTSRMEERFHHRYYLLWHPRIQLASLPPPKSPSRRKFLRRFGEDGRAFWASLSESMSNLPTSTPSISLGRRRLTNA